MTTFEYEGKDYELKLTRAGIRAAEAAGLSTSELGDKPFSAVSLLFFAALHSYRVNYAKATKMLDELLDAETVTFEELFTELAEAYNELFGLGGSED